MKLGAVVEPGRDFSLDSVDPDDTSPFSGKDDPDLVARKEKDLARLEDLQERLYAEKSRAVLVVLQAPDAAGKDGVLRHVVGPLDSRGVTVVSFKVPAGEERQHDYLWRVHRETPRFGEMVFFNRSHYEEVLVPRVMETLPKSVWEKRYDQINDFERMLTESGTTIVKLFLHISKGEQKKRLLERIEKPDKHWKFDPSDLEARSHWDAYEEAYDAMLTRCSTSHAPWIVVPANHKWYRDAVVGRRLVEALEAIDPRYPAPPDIDFSKITVE